MPIKSNTVNSVYSLLDRLEQLDIRLFLEQGQLKFNAPKGRMTDNLASEIKAAKDSIVDLLQTEAAARKLLDDPIPVTDAPNGYPLSFAQQRFWFLDQLAGGNSPTYNMMPVVLRVVGNLNTTALQLAFNALLLRHTVLSNRFSIVDDEPRQWPGQPGEVPLTIYDLSVTEQYEEQLGDIIRDEGERPFDLAKGGPLLRLGLVKIGSQHHILILTKHHIISDGVSFGILVNDFSVFYEQAIHSLEKSGSWSKTSEFSSLQPAGKHVNQGSKDHSTFPNFEDARLPELKVHYGDFAAWEKQRLGKKFLQRRLHFWKTSLAQAPTLLELPTDRPRPRLQSYNGKTLPFVLDHQITTRVNACASSNGVTNFMVLISAFGVLLSRYSRQKDIIIGSPLSVRSHSETSHLMGLFLNTVPLRIKLDENPGFAELLGQIRKTALAAFENGETPFDAIMQELETPRALNHTPLFQVLFALQNAPVGSADTGDLKITPVEPENSKAPFDLVLIMEETGGIIEGRFRYNTDLFERSTIERMALHFQNILNAAITDTSTPVALLPMLSEGEIGWLAKVRGGNYESTVHATIHDAITEQARRRPEAIALHCDGEERTYQTLDIHSNQIASLLKSHKIEPGDRVGICMSRSADLISAIIGILKSGAAYVPLDPAYPDERLAFMAQDAGLSLIFFDDETKCRLPQFDLYRLLLNDIDFSNQIYETLPRQSPQDAAYVIYTSGSTGLPKGVEVTHANVMRLFGCSESLFGFGQDDIWTMFHSYAFDFSVWEIFGALIYGGKLIVVPYWISRSPDSFYELLEKQQVTVLNQTPSAFRQLIETDVKLNEARLPLKWVIFGGEALDFRSLERWTGKYGTEQPQLINMYGITETTVHVTYHKVTETDILRGISTIGYPLPDLTADLVDENNQLVPVGVAGEILVGGDGVARGYLNRPELTAQRFVNYLHPGNPVHQRIYRSGDLARRLPDGSLEYLGRIDQQVKIRGFRIEIGEIEARISTFPDVAESVVTIRDGSSGKELAGYVVFREGSDSVLSMQALKEHLRAQLPDYMVPAHLVDLPVMPLTANGKIDRKALPEPAGLQRSSTEIIPPVSPLEKLIAGFWIDILQLKNVGINENFFDLGGDSIKGAIFANRMQLEIGSVFYVVALFEAPTIRELIGYMRTHYPEALERFGDTGTKSYESKTRLNSKDLETLANAIIPLSTYPAIRQLPRNKPAIFVLAPPRSGTTLLRVLLGGHSRLFAPPELELMPFNSLDERRQVCSGRDAMWLEGTLRAVMEVLNLDADAAKDRMKQYEDQDMPVMQFYGELQQWLGDRILVDKSPSYVLHASILERIEETFENPVYIHLHRHPYGMIHSFEEAKLHQIFFSLPKK